MKNFNKIISAALISLCAMHGAQADRDGDYDNHGQSLCQFGDRVLAPTGFIQGGIYTTESINQILSRMHVSARSFRPLIPGCRYQVAYSCSVYHRLATGTFAALPVSPMHKGEPGALVQWEFSKFFPI